MTSVTRFVKHLIVGAGPTGLGAAYRLKELGEQSVLVIEQNDYVGGLATSFRDDAGFTWDIGGHVQFSHYDYFDTLMQRALGDDGWLHHQRESWAWMEQRFVPYPIQNNIRHLPREAMWRCLEGLIEIHKNPRRDVPANFREWILATFGPGLADQFMVPYNYKVWAYPPEDLSYGWVGERVSVTDLARVTKNILFERDDISWGPNATFRFPRRGGTGAIWKAVGELVGADRISLRTSLLRIDYDRREAVVSRMGREETIRFETLMSTMPLDLVVHAIRPAASAELIEAAEQLRYSTSHIIGLGMTGTPPEALRTKCWMYFPEADSPFYRVTVFSNYSPHNVPDSTQHWSLMAEVSESGKKPVNRERLVEDVIQGALNTKLITSRDALVSTWTHSVARGYPTPSLGRDHALAVLLPALDRLGIYCRGRFGAWKYEVSNQDHSCMQGVEWANRMVLGIPETTMPFPNTANANWGRPLAA